MNPPQRGRVVLLKSKAFWGAVIYAVARVIAAKPEERLPAAVEGAGVVLSAAGIRTAISKNGEGK